MTVLDGGALEELAGDGVLSEGESCLGGDVILAGMPGQMASYALRAIARMVRCGFTDAVRLGTFPDAKHTVPMPREEHDLFLASLDT